MSNFPCCYVCYGSLPAGSEVMFVALGWRPLAPAHIRSSDPSELCYTCTYNAFCMCTVSYEFVKIVTVADMQ